MESRNSLSTFYCVVGGMSLPRTALSCSVRPMPITLHLQVVDLHPLPFQASSQWFFRTHYRSSLSWQTVGRTFPVHRAVAIGYCPHLHLHYTIGFKVCQEGFKKFFFNLRADLPQQSGFLTLLSGLSACLPLLTVFIIPQICGLVKGFWSSSKNFFREGPPFIT